MNPEIAVEEMVDTNIVLRYILDDVPDQSRRCRELFYETAQGRRRLWASEVAVAEVVWVLSSKGGPNLTRATIVAALTRVIETPHFTVGSGAIVLQALQLYLRHNIDYVDAYHAALLESRGESAILSFDRDFDKISWIGRREP